MCEALKERRKKERKKGKVPQYPIQYKLYLLHKNLIGAECF
jgi:hypothetical protein